MASSSTPDRSKLPAWADPMLNGGAPRSRGGELPSEFWRTILDTLRASTFDLRPAP